MNLHEECLLRYLLFPDELLYSTEILKLNNKIFEEKFITENLLAQMKSFKYAISIN